MENNDNIVQGGHGRTEQNILDAAYAIGIMAAAFGVACLIHLVILIVKG